MTKKVASKKSTVASKKKIEKSSGDVISIQNVGSGAAVAAGRGAKASVISNKSLSSIVEWMAQINKKINSLPDISQAEKEDIKQQVEKIGDEAQKGSKAEVGRLEKLINTLNVMAPDIFDVVIATLANPLAGIGLVIKKIGDKAKLERDDSKA
jgi:septum formation inhibitor MinC